MASLLLSILNGMPLCKFQYNGTVEDRHLQIEIVMHKGYISVSISFEGKMYSI